MPTILQAFGFACMAFAFTLLAKPRIRPSPATYLWALGIDALCILFLFGTIVVWPHWWLLCPMIIWGGVTVLHYYRLRDAQIMVKVLEANHPPLWAPGRLPDRQSDAYGYDDWTDDAPEHRPRY